MKVLIMSEQTKKVQVITDWLDRDTDPRTTRPILHIKNGEHTVREIVDCTSKSLGSKLDNIIPFPCDEEGKVNGAALTSYDKKWGPGYIKWFIVQAGGSA